MAFLAVFLVALVVVYAVKAAAVLRAHDELVKQSVSFSWMSARSEDAARAENWAAEEEAAAEARARSAQGSFAGVHRVGGARA